MNVPCFALLTARASASEPVVVEGVLDAPARIYVHQGGRRGVLVARGSGDDLYLHWLETTPPPDRDPALPPCADWARAIRQSASLCEQAPPTGGKLRGEVRLRRRSWGLSAELAGYGRGTEQWVWQPVPARMALEPPDAWEIALPGFGWEAAAWGVGVPLFLPEPVTPPPTRVVRGICSLDEIERVLDDADGVEVVGPTLAEALERVRQLGTVERPPLVVVRAEVPASVELPPHTMRAKPVLVSPDLDGLAATGDRYVLTRLWEVTEPPTDWHSVRHRVEGVVFTAEALRERPDLIEQAWLAGLWVFVGARASDLAGLPRTDAVLLVPEGGCYPPGVEEGP
ncbi:MAG: hypothetical protein H6735_34270 [Alphaproteobacteria bacterium]|nr:hypothetical protein [Alphaproteobacteria bacterium]